MVSLVVNEGPSVQIYKLCSTNRKLLSFVFVHTSRITTVNCLSFQIFCRSPSVELACPFGSIGTFNQVTKALPNHN